MWAIQYSEEVKLYFIDNGPYTFDLLVKLEELKFYADALPPEGCLQIDLGWYMWLILNHIVIYEITPTTKSLTIWVVKPVDTTLQ